jgi:hypothetical protein
MSLKLKIVIGIFAVYSIVVSVLLIVAGNKLSVVDSEKLKYQKIEHLINDVKASNQKIQQTIQQDELKIDSITTLILRIDQNIDYFNNQKTIVYTKYKSQLDDLKDKTLDEMKQIALSD